MFGWAKKLKADFNEAREQTAIDKRNAERRELCAEYARIPHDPARRGAIIHRLAQLSGEANLEAVTLRLAIELEGIDRRSPQAEVLRGKPFHRETPSHFESDLKHFRADYCGGPRAVVEDDACLGGVKA